MHPSGPSGNQPGTPMPVFLSRLEYLVWYLCQLRFPGEVLYDTIVEVLIALFRICAQNLAPGSSSRFVMHELLRRAEMNFVLQDPSGSFYMQRLLQISAEERTPRFQENLQIHAIRPGLEIEGGIVGRCDVEILSLGVILREVCFKYNWGILTVCPPLFDSYDTKRSRTFEVQPTKTELLDGEILQAAYDYSLKTLGCPLWQLLNIPILEWAWRRAYQPSEAAVRMYSPEEIDNYAYWSKHHHGAQATNYAHQQSVAQSLSVNPVNISVTAGILNELKDETKV